MRVQLPQEHRFQQEKQDMNLLRAAQEGRLVPAELSDELLHKVDALTEKEQAALRARLRKEARLEQKMESKAPAWRHRMLWLMNPAWLPFAPNQAKVTRTLNLASCFVVGDVARAGEEVMWTASLQGGLLVDLVFLKSGGQQGVAMEFQAANNVKRAILVSQQFRAVEPRLAEIVDRACSAASSKWISVPDWERWAAVFERRAGPDVRSKQPMTVLALAPPALCQSMDLQSVMDKATFISFVTRIHCAMRGMCNDDV